MSPSIGLQGLGAPEVREEHAEPAVAGDLSFGQLSIWSNIAGLPRARWAEPNMSAVWPMPPAVTPEAAVVALRRVAERHESLRTTYVLDDPRRPRQICRPSVDALDVRVLAGESVDPVAYCADLGREPFDLRSAPAWRARLLCDGGLVTHIVIAHHHILADAWAQAILREDLGLALADPARFDRLPRAKGPIALAEEQRSAAARARWEATERYWTRAVRPAGSGDPPAVAAPGDPGRTEALQANLRTVRLRASAVAVAERSGVSVGSVLLAAYSMAVAQAHRLSSVPLRLVASNRFRAAWRDCVTSMNQYAPLRVDVPHDADLASMAAQVHRGSLSAYRHGMYPPPLGAPPARPGQHAGTGNPAAWGFNYSNTRSPEDPLFADADPPNVQWEVPMHAFGPHVYLRAFDDGRNTFNLQLRARGYDRDHLPALLWRLQELITLGAAR